MATNAKAAALCALQEIPGVGPSIAADLYALGLREVDDLVGRDPEAMYERSCELQGVRIDRCLLYVYRCAVNYATHRPTDPQAKLWWNWKDGGRFARRRP
jgi:Pathogenicity locus